jgi:hypothetical protein
VEANRQHFDQRQTINPHAMSVVQMIGGQVDIFAHAAIGMHPEHPQ